VTLGGGRDGAGLNWPGAGIVVSSTNDAGSVSGIGY
jgi:hypothetical protein